jgi:sporulation protein YlmC with PRC-barrel domain
MHSVPNAGYITATRVTGTPVYDTAGEKLGQVEDIVLTKAEGQAVYAVLSFGGFLGMGQDHYPLPWSILKYDTGRGGYVVDVTREQLEGAPRHGAGEAPEWGDPAWHTRVTDHYSRPVVDPVEGEVLGRR